MNFNEHIKKELLNEYAGSEKKKTVILDDGKKYLLKFPDPIREQKRKLSYINNAFSEYISCKIFQSLGIPTQNVILGTYTEENGNEKIVCACEDIRKDGEIMHEIDKLELESVDSESKRELTFSSIEQTLKEIKAVPVEELRKFYYNMFVVDSLIGNTDRHNGNWALLSNNDGVRIAPVYDCGSSLCPLVDETEITDRFTYLNAMSITSMLHDEEHSRINYTEFYQKELSEPLKKALFEILPKVNFDKINKIIEDTPYISDKRKNFYKQILSIRYEKILLPALIRELEPNKDIIKEDVNYYGYYVENLKQLKNVSYEQEIIKIQNQDLKVSKAGKHNVYCYNGDKVVGVISNRSNNGDVRNTILVLQNIGLDIDLSNNIRKLKVETKTPEKKTVPSVSVPKR
jgi:hypothetical protein